MTWINDNNRKWWVLTAMSLASFIGSTDFSIVNTALPVIQTEFEASVLELQWVINLFVIALSTFNVIMGRLADIHGRRRTLYIGLILFALASFGAGLASNIYWLILFRGLQGLACAILNTAAGAIVTNVFPSNERGRAIGILFGINGIGLAAGPAIGGIIVSFLGWRWIFLISIPLIVLSIFLCYLSTDESKAEHQTVKLDWTGLVTLLLALPTLIVAICQSPTWGLVPTVILLLTSFAAFCLFVFIELNKATPLIEFHLLANKKFIGNVVASFFLAVFYCLAFFLMPLYLYHARDYSAHWVGFMLLPATASVAIFSPIIGRMTDQYGPRILLITGYCFLIISAILQTFLSATTPIGFIIIAFTCMGIGWVCILGPSTVGALSSVPENRAALAMGTKWTLHNIGSVLGLAIGTVIYQKVTEYTLMSLLLEQQITPGAWLSQVLSNPDQAIETLLANTPLTEAQSHAVFHQAFCTGYHACMYFLLTTSLVALLVILLMMKREPSLAAQQQKKPLGEKDEYCSQKQPGTVE